MYSKLKIQKILILIFPKKCRCSFETNTLQWFILVITFFSIIVAGIVRSSSRVFIEPFEMEFGWDRLVISLAFVIGLFLYGFSGAFLMTGAFYLLASLFVIVIKKQHVAMEEDVVDV